MAQHTCSGAHLLCPLVPGNMGFLFPTFEGLQGNFYVTYIHPHAEATSNPSTSTLATGPAMLYARTIYNCTRHAQCSGEQRCWGFVSRLLVPLHRARGGRRFLRRRPSDLTRALDVVDCMSTGEGGGDSRALRHTQRYPAVVELDCSIERGMISMAGGYWGQDSVNRRRLTLNRRRLALNPRPLMVNRSRLAGLALCGGPRVPEAVLRF